MFTEGKIFTKNSYFNSENDVVWADDRSGATERHGLYSNEKYPVSIMGAIWYGLTSPYFFQQGQHLNGQTYRDELLPFYQRKVMNCSDTKIGGWFQQDGASSHTDHKVQ